MSREPVAWVFNLDAEDELKRGRGPHTPSNAVRLRAEGLLPALRGLMQPGDEVLWPEAPAGVSALKRLAPAALAGRAWCPTPWALSQMKRAGLRLPEAPSASVLRQVNHRRFAHSLGQGLPLAQMVDDHAALLEVLRDRDGALPKVSLENNWLMKLPLGYAGRGRRKIKPGGELTAADTVWINAALEAGDGLQVEPMVVRELDCAIHGLLEANGAFVLGQPTTFTADASGTWRSTCIAEPGALAVAELDALEEAARATAMALHDAGYFGPFGLDAFRWRAPDGATHFQPRCELNARYSMGWATGMAGT